MVTIGNKSFPAGHLLISLKFKCIHKTVQSLPKMWLENMCYFMMLISVFHLETPVGPYAYRRDMKLTVDEFCILSISRKMNPNMAKL